MASKLPSKVRCGAVSQNIGRRNCVKEEEAEEKEEERGLKLVR